MITLNNSAFALRKQLNADLGRRYTIRRKHVTTGTRVVRATRSRAVAQVGTTRGYLGDHVTGGVRTNTAIPTKAMRRNPRSVITRRRWPGALRGGRFFMLDLGRRKTPSGFGARSGRFRKLLFRRGTGRSRKLKLLWAVANVQPVKPTWPFEAIATREHQAHFEREFPANFLHALRTAKPDKIK